MKKFLALLAFSLTIVSCSPENKQLRVNKLPDKINYTIGESLDLTGLEVRCNTLFITDYEVNPGQGYVFTEERSYKITISKEGYKSTTFNVWVKDEESINHEDQNVNVYYINDTHGAFNYQEVDGNHTEAGMSFISGLLKSYREIDNEAIILSGGDMFQGGLESNFTRGDIMIDAMNEIGFDAMVLGNHEFDWGEEYIRGFSSKLDCPIISSNVFYRDTNIRPDYLTPYTIIERHGVKIGIVGGAQKDLNGSISGSISSAFSFPDPIPYLKQYSDELKTTQGCDLVFVAVHDGGFTDSNTFKYSSLTEISSVSGEKYADAIFLAHDHIRKMGEFNNVPYLEAACNGRALAKLNFECRYYQTDYDVRNYVYNSSFFDYMYDDFSIYNDSNIDALLDKYADVIPDPDEVLCTFSRSYSKEEIAYMICRAMMWFVNNNSSFFDNTTVYGSIHNFGGVRVSSVEAGDFTFADLVKAVPFDNSLCIQTCTQYNLNYMNNNSSLAFYSTEPISNLPYEDGVIKTVTISYVAENERYGQYYQQSYVAYPSFYGRDAFMSYLQSGVEEL